jgi:hypothetical protein
MRTQQETETMDLTTAQIEKITDQLVALRKTLLSNGATALNPTAEWTALRKEISLLNKKLNADAKAKLSAKELELGPDDSMPAVPLEE